MNIAVLGGHGRIGQRIVREALQRGHRVTVISRRENAANDFSGEASFRSADVTDWSSLRDAIANHDAVISAIGPASHAPEHVEILVTAAHNLIRALPAANVQRLLVVGGAGTLEVAPGVQRIDTENYPAQYRPSGLAQRAALDLYRASALEWTYVSPPILIDAGARTGRYRTAFDTVIYDGDGRSAISMEDYAVALLDEIERPAFVRRRFTVAY